MFRPKKERSVSTMCVALLLLGGMERNPGPGKGHVLGVLNTRSAVHKAAAIHDVVRDGNLDIVAITESWVPSNAPDAIKLDIAPLVSRSYTRPEIHPKRKEAAALRFFSGKRSRQPKSTSVARVNSNRWRSSLPPNQRPSSLFVCTGQER